MADFDLGIIGAGPAGLTLARILFHQNSSLSIAIFEADPSPEARSQGGVLDLKKGSGQEALKKAGIYEEWRKLARVDESAVRILDRHGTVHYQEAEETQPDEDGEYYNPEIDRGDLRKILLDSLPTSVVHWNHKLNTITWHEDEQLFELAFQSGTKKVKKLVGADGAWSKVRSQVLDKQQPVYTGLSFADFTIPSLFRQSHPELVKLVGTGHSFALNDDTGLNFHPTRVGNLSVYAIMRTSETWYKDSEAGKAKGKEQLKAVAKELFSDWSSDLLKVFECADEESIVLRTMNALPVGFKWKHHKACTLIGDAAHVMSPFAGEGVNLAMTDALELADCLLANKPLSDFETKMWPRVQISAEESARNLELFFGPDSCKNTVEIFKSHGPPPEAGQQ